MRRLATFDSGPDAQRFVAALFVRGIESVPEPDESGRVEVWVLEEDRQEEAAKILLRFRENPGAPEFAGAEQVAAVEKARLRREEEGRRSEVLDGARLGYERSFMGGAVVTSVLITLSVVLAFFSRLGEDRGALAPYMISNFYRDASGVSYHLPTLREKGASQEAVREGLGFLPEVARGELWRLVTPIFIHFGILHLVFNLMMLRNLGGAIEVRFGPVYLGVLILALALGSNLAQAIWKSPNFGGMSGVDYGLFGFLWIRGRRDRFATWQVPSSTVSMMLVWFFLCVLGVIPDVANGAHAAGLCLGMAWGWVSARR